MTNVLRKNGKRQAKITGGEGFKALVIDIEMSPNLALCWGLWDQNISLAQLKESASMICFAAKWYGDPKKDIIFYSDFHDGHDVMVKAAWELINEADALIHFNGRSFDVKHMNREFILAGLTPPSPHKDIDLLTVTKSRFRFPSNKLEYVGQALGVGKKVENSGFKLWVQCMAGDAKAWAEMKKYNIGDIVVTEDLYTRLLPWIKGHPHVGLYTGDTHSCPNCAGTDLQRRGWYRTSTSVYQQYWCKTCGAWSRESKNNKVSSTDTRTVT